MYEAKKKRKTQCWIKIGIYYFIYLIKFWKLGVALLEDQTIICAFNVGFRRDYILIKLQLFEALQQNRGYFKWNLHLMAYKD